MLQSNMSASERRRGAIALPVTEPNIGAMIQFAVSFLRRRYLVILAITAAAFALGFAYIRVTPPTYTAVAQVLLETPRGQFVQKESPLAEPVLDFTQIETQIQIVRSPALANIVIEQQKLYNDPDLTRAPPSLGGLWRLLRDRLWPPASSPESAVASPLTLVGPFLARLDVRRLGSSNILEISYSSSGSAHAALIANAVAQAYIDDQTSAKSAAARQAIGWLQDRLISLGDQEQTAQRAVDAYRTAHDMVASNGTSIDEQQIADLNGRLVAASAQTSQALAKANKVRAILGAEGPEAKDVDTLGAAGSDALGSPIINSLRTEYMQLQRREVEWSARYGAKHSAVVDLQTRMRAIRASIREELHRFSETSRNEYEVALKGEQALERQLDEAVSQSRTTDKAAVVLRELEARAKGYRELHDTFQQRYMGAVQLESFPISAARVLSPAFAPDSKSKPKTTLMLGLSGFVGLALGAGLGLLRDLTDGVFRTPGQVEAVLQLPCLSLIPKVKAQRSRQPQSADSSRRLAANGHSLDALVVASPLSHFAESVRAIGIEVELGTTGGRNEVIGVTSALPSEGKTTLATSLARLVAHSGKRVILVDCDLRRPSLSAAMAPEAAVGLVEVAHGTIQLEDAVWRDPQTELDILPAVCRKPALHTSEFLASAPTRLLFERLRATYDYVIVDLPPLSPVVDARASGAFIDAYVLAIEWGKTRVETVRRALHDAPNVHENIVGAVLNKANMKAMRRYDGGAFNTRNYELYQNRQVRVRT